MTRFFISLLIALPLELFAVELKVGDILLQPLGCWTCALIEAQEQTPYSHMGMVIEVGEEIKVVEALGTVKVMSFAKFDERTKKGQSLLVLRLKNKKAVHYLQSHQSQLLTYFSSSFEGLPYDHDFRWNNYDEAGREKLYCSEFVAKLYKNFLGIELPLKKMKFDVNRDEWIRYFNGNPPDDYPGNSPVTFSSSSLFFEVGEL